MVRCCTQNRTMVLDKYKLIRKDRQGRRGEAVVLCAKELFNSVDLQYETGSEPLAQYHTGGKGQGRNTWDAEVGSVAISLRNQMAVLGTVLLHSSSPGDRAW